MAGLVPDIFDVEAFMEWYENNPITRDFIDIDFVFRPKPVPPTEEELKEQKRIEEYNKALKLKEQQRAKDPNGDILDYLEDYISYKESYIYGKNKGILLNESNWLQCIAKKEKQLEEWGITEDMIQTKTIPIGWLRKSLRG